MPISPPTRIPGDTVLSRPLLVIGGGNMASAIIEGATTAGVLLTPPIVIEPDDTRRSRHPRGVRDLDAGVEALLEEEQRSKITGGVMLAVKPQVFASVCDEHLQSERPLDSRAVTSVMAGIQADTIQERFAPNGRVVRVMPNTPAAVGLGISAISLGATATADDAAYAERLMNSVGRVLRIDESLIDVFTGVAGSGPAYVFHFTEALIEAARRNGLSEDDATRAAVQTVVGAGALLADAYDSGRGTAESLRRAVTSPNGTTAAGLAILDQAGLDDVLCKAVRAAAERGAELASE